MTKRKWIVICAGIFAVLIILFTILGVVLMIRDDDQDTDKGHHRKDFDSYFSNTEEEEAIDVSEKINSTKYLEDHIYEDLPVRSIQEYLQRFQESYNDVKDNRSETDVTFRYRARSRFFTHCDMTISRLIDRKDDYDNDRPFDIEINATVNGDYSEYYRYFNPTFSNKWSRIGFNFNGTWDVRGGKGDHDEFSFSRSFSNVFIVELRLFHDVGGCSTWITQYVLMNEDHELMMISQTYSHADD